MSNDIKVMFGAVGSFVASWFGGWTSALQFAVILMAIDIIMGYMVAIFFKSPKTVNGGLSSNVSWKGMCKKCTMLIFVIIGHNIDITFSMDYVKTGVCIAIIVNELTSIIENGKLMGVNIPIISEVVEVISKDKGTIEK